MHRETRSPTIVATSLLVAVLVMVAATVARPRIALAQPPDSPPSTAAEDDLGGLLEGLDLGSPTPTASEEADSGATPAGQSPDANSVETDGATGDGGALLRAYQSMLSARDLLRQGQTGDPTQQAQQQAVALLDEMIRQSEAASSWDSSSGAQSSSGDSAQQASSAAPGVGSSGTVPQSGDADAGEAMDDAAGGRDAAADGGGEAPEAEVTAGRGRERQGLDAAGEGVWGHLPPRMRGMLRSEMPTEYLPGYADQISDYFRALAEVPVDD